MSMVRQYCKAEQNLGYVRIKITLKLHEKWVF